MVNIIPPKVIGGQLGNGQIPTNTNFKPSGSGGGDIFTDYAGMGNAPTFAQTNNAGFDLKNYLDNFQPTEKKEPGKTKAEKLANGFNIANMGISLATAGASLATGVKGLFGGGDKKTASSVDAAKVLSNPNASKSEIKQALASAEGESAKLTKEAPTLKANAEKATTAYADATAAKNSADTSWQEAITATTDAKSAYNNLPEKIDDPSSTTEPKAQINNPKKAEAKIAFEKAEKAEADAKTAFEKADEADKSALKAKNEANTAVDTNATSQTTADANVAKLKTMLTEKKGSRDGAIENDGVFKEANGMKSKTDEQKKAKLIEAHNILAKAELSDSDITLLQDAKNDSKSLSGAIDAYCTRRGLDTKTLKVPQQLPENYEESLGSGGMMNDRA